MKVSHRAALAAAVLPSSAAGTRPTFRALRFGASPPRTGCKRFDRNDEFSVYRRWREVRTRVPLPPFGPSAPELIACGGRVLIQPIVETENA